MRLVSALGFVVGGWLGLKDKVMCSVIDHCVAMSSFSLAGASALDLDWAALISVSTAEVIFERTATGEVTLICVSNDQIGVETTLLHSVGTSKAFPGYPSSGFRACQSGAHGSSGSLSPSYPHPRNPG